ncbi:TetR/AcrR family transcriptional regulator [uncultured Marixanthomonas sp.]|uniref:TetR/AcrR family transcriptional regulator n=1 Tax=uncultured Marixanthomonas sp. TaxID=757245 RepID=UPI0030D7F5CF|tara:strand:+ start:165907 stop:166464 length:558 start_codon:yes stop_codon:yes gene_type:complete
MDKTERILDAALELIIERGLERTPMSKIADRAEVGMGTVYKYFENKEHIINGIYVKIKEEEAALVFVNNGFNKDVYETFKDYYSRMIDYFLNNPLKFNFISQYAFSPLINAETQKKAMSRFHHFDTLYKKGHQEDLFKTIKAEHLTFFVFSAIAYWIKSANELHITIDTQYKNTLIQMAWDAIKK